MKTIKRILLGVFVLVLVYEIFIISLVFSESNKTVKDVDTIIVLGAKVWESGPSPVFKERLDAAYEYLISNPDTLAVISGGKGEDEPLSEGLSGYNYLVDKGIEPSRLDYEDQSTTTIENIKLSMAKIESTNIALVSNDYHIYRATLLGKRLGYKNVKGLAAKSKTSDTFKAYLREIAALSYHFIFTHP